MALLDELAQQISARTGIPAEKAEAAARTAIEFLDDRLPPPIGGQLGKLVGGEGGGAPDLGKLAGGLGGLFGGK